MIKEKYKIAFEKAQAVTDMLSNNYSDDHFVQLDDIIIAVKKISGYSEINVMQIPFSSIKGLSKKKSYNNACSFGAMLNTRIRKNAKTGQDEKVADLVINSDYDADMQRFSVAHELGHLITQIPNFIYDNPDDGKFTLSAHVHPDITFIPEEDCQKDNYLFAEQVANIFALLVLIPQRVTIRTIKNVGIEKLKSKYGVTEDAIYSRMLLSSAS